MVTRSITVSLWPTLKPPFGARLNAAYYYLYTTSAEVYLFRFGSVGNVDFLQRLLCQKLLQLEVVTPLASSAEEAAERASHWLMSRMEGGAWKVRMEENDYPPATAYSLNIVFGSRRERTISYVFENKIWRKDIFSTMTIVTALLRTEETSTAKEVLKECITDRNRGLLGDRRIVPILEGLMEGRKQAPSAVTSSLPLLFRLYPDHLWYSRTSALYNLLPPVSEALVQHSKRLDDLIRLRLRLALNKDGSYGGVVIQTMQVARILQQIGEDRLARRVLSWIEKAYNQNGSYQPFVYQDVFDTAWAALALSDHSQVPSGTIPWLERTRVGDGYPYYSDSYFPDCDDTPLLMLLKMKLGLNDEAFEDSLSFLLKAQNPDGGWPFIPLKTLSVGSPGLLAMRMAGDWYWRSPIRAVFPAVMAVRIHLSVLDLTFRTVDVLHHFSERREVRKALERATRFLLNNYQGAKFHAIRRWYISDVCDTASAVMALHLCGYRGPEVSSGMEWLAQQRPTGADDVAHILWAHMETGSKSKTSQELLADIIGKQRPDGSWPPSVGWLEEGVYFDSVFSTAVPLYVLSKYLKERQSVENAG
jgi:hypothetical protein